MAWKRNGFNTKKAITFIASRLLMLLLYLFEIIDSQGRKAAKTSFIEE